jgi:hypothetical protein
LFVFFNAIVSCKPTIKVAICLRLGDKAGTLKSTKEFYMKALSEKEVHLVSGGEGADFSDVTATVDSTAEIIEPTPNWPAFIPGMFR